MARASDKREKLIDAAKTLIHRQGFHRTTLADIAEESRVPLGNVYYYFKTKEELCEAVLEERRKEIRHMLEGCCKQSGSRENLKRLIRKMMSGSEEVAECGCPHGSLIQELGKMPTPLTDSADGVMQILIDWASDQFRELGVDKPEEHGFEFIARIQGTMLLGHAMHDPKRIKQQLKGIGNWIDSL